MNNNNYSNLNIFHSNNPTRTNVVFVPQATNIQTNGNNLNIFGPPLIPVVNEVPISATQRIKQVENVIKREKDMSKGFDEKELLKLVKKCDLHPHKLSDKCRKCKEVKKEIEKIEEERKVLEDKRFRSNTDDKEANISKSQEHGEPDINSIHNINSINNTLNPLLKPFKTHGDPVTCNLNTLIHNNILSNQYFKELFSSKGFNETLDEIIQNAKYAEPWTVGTNGIPSTLFCCLYRLMLCQLSEGQVRLLLSNEDSAYIRCAGFLYIRYLCDPKDLWTWFSPYILDEQEFSPTANVRMKITMGEYVEMLLREYDYYGTRLPRIPVTIERELKMKLLMIPEKRQRKKENLINSSKFQTGVKCRAISSQDNEWHNCSVVELLGMKACRVHFTGGKEIALEKTENKWFNHEMFLMKVNEFKKQNNNNVFFSGEEIVDLGNILLLEEDLESGEKEKKKKKSNSRERKRRKRSDSRSRSRSKSRKKKNKHRSRSRESSPRHSKKEKNIYEKILEQERNAAVAKGRDYAVRPTSYKSSLSQAVPTGNQKRRSKSPVLKQKIEIIQRKRSPEKDKKEEKEVSKEYLELQKKLKEQYGDSSTNEKKNSNYYGNQGKTKDILQPDVMKLGK